MCRHLCGMRKNRVCTSRVVSTDQTGTPCPFRHRPTHGPWLPGHVSFSGVCDGYHRSDCAASIRFPPRDPLYRDDDDPDYQVCDPFVEICEDLDFVDQWGLFKAEAESAWNITTGSSSVVIAVLDSGVDLDHDDLIDKIWVNPGEVAR